MFYQSRTTQLRLTVGPRAHAASTVFRMLAATLALVMFVCLPFERAHSFTNHLRPPVTRRAAQRHTSIAQPDTSPAEQVIKCPLLPTPFIAMAITAPTLPLLDSESRPDLPLPRLLRRLKLGIARASSPDPLS